MNDFIYLKFNAPASQSNQIIARPVKTLVWNALIKVLTTILPKANPDFEELIEKVAFWKIEFIKEESAVYREIKFNRNGKAIVAMPLDENYCYFTDNSLLLLDYQKFKSTLIEAKEFEQDWWEFIKN
ncbi:hypothetical protein [Adhaeribacter pallidiroseus]|nr:hypothetical protein [Adhaeribacter pallidiroseus]